MIKFSGISHLAMATDDRERASNPPRGISGVLSCLEKLLANYPKSAYWMKKNQEIIKYGG